ncbi:hypothetical protein RGU12_00330 [Fredinandcohnia sp. QZ13]|uniref:hypothetical protein n=1 Tax=Fredinandcohnia sp. QZ13 TaxID=3073144 RepID=UPI0028536A22|nr:hypothetical protein [Fredinandcohnia sp. QZ13]MDR4885990.1 hypothetical protein [Fredinandcohnia sp. QZ13]
MNLRVEQYVAMLLLISFGTFFLLGTWLGGTNEPYRDFLLTFTVVHFVMWKLITIKKKEEKKE